ncbi:Peroxisome bioproteinsis protein 2 [Hibiscus syriacus]|uniref:RING-type E3 ubiquitin transferase (cysteine targeting) n=1 Tax=Hibiscus syriacus TaxID=106335 RepID=A0A6A2WHN8_HIBSY|nr:Peroxisome bioproteinsis protein 2 [Hibiscus syriacus]
MVNVRGNPSPAATPEEDAWVTPNQMLFPLWHTLSLSYQHSTLPISISRVNQFDAARLDVEMSAMLKEQLVKVFSSMKPGMLFQYEPELDTFLELLIWRFSIWVDKPTPGIALMNLRYRDERAMEIRGNDRTGLEGPGLTITQKMWYCIAAVGGQYIGARLQSFSAFRRWGDSEQRGWNLMQQIEWLYKAASFGNLLIFLYTGRYRNLIERALRARLVYASPNMNPAVSFEYMNHQAIIHKLATGFKNFERCCCSFSLFLTRQPLNVFSVRYQRIRVKVLQMMPLIVPSAGQVQHFLMLLYLVSSGAPSFRCPRCNEPVAAMQ